MVYKYRRIPKVMTLVTFGFSNLWRTLLSGVVTFGYQILFVKVKNEHDIAKHLGKSWFLHCVTRCHLPC